jgi:hypothetical protein
MNERLRPPSVFASLIALGTTVSVSISLLVIFFLIAELASFGTFRLRQGQATAIGEAPYLYPGQPWAQQFWKEAQRADKYQYEPYVVWRHAPFSGQFVNVDTNGVRRTVNSDCSAGGYRIWMFGNSTMWGTSVPDAETIPSIMARHYATTRGPVCVINFGESAWVSTQEVVQLMLALKNSPRPPDLVIFCDGPSDVLVQYETGETDLHDNFDQIKRSVDKVGEKRGGFAYLKQTNTYLMLVRAMNELNRRLPTPPDSTLPMRNLDLSAHAATDNYLENLTLVRAFASSYGFRYIAFLGPAIFLGDKPLSPEEASLRKGLDKGVPGMAQLFRKTYDGILNAHNSHIVDIENAFDNTPDALYVGMAHVSPQGNHLIADRMFEVLQDRGF